MDFSDLFSNGKSDGPGTRRVDQVARLGSIKRVQRRLVDARALGLTGAHRRWWRRMSQTRRCRRGAHRSTSGGKEAA
jgi:hypothetical protein